MEKPYCSIYSNLYTIIILVLDVMDGILASIDVS